MSVRIVLLTATAAASLAACAQTGPFLGGTPSEPARTATGNPWFDGAQDALAARKAQKPNKARARNVILFVADGMDPTTVAAARIYDGQTRGEEGEENLLSFENFPNLAMSKTYTTDYQVADSAGTMSAMVTGVKTRSGVLSISHEAARGSCADALAYEVKTLGELAEMAGMAVGVVSTATITHATPGAVYAHSADRGWEVDSEMPPEAIEAGCKDIARQLIEFPYGDGLEVAMSGGRAYFLPETAADPEEEDVTGARKDGRDLTQEWVAKSDDHIFVWDQAGFDALNSDAKVLGLFDSAHLDLEIERVEKDVAGQPSLEEMTRKAIKLLSNDKDGFFLMVEAGRVDHAHHAGSARGALSETQEYAEAVAAARAMTSDKDTLIVVTADHGHTLSFQGYPIKGNDILGLAMEPGENGEPELSLALDGKPYTTLGYANGPGTVFQEGVDLSNGRPVPNPEDFKDWRYRAQALIPTSGETHGGQDVPIYASGPGAYLFSGVVEQNYIFHVIDHALRLMERTEE